MSEQRSSDHKQRLYIANAFSLGMLETSPTKEVLLRIK